MIQTAGGIADLLVFTSPGRASLLERTVACLRSQCTEETFNRKILSIDGHDPEILGLEVLSWFDRIVFSTTAAGYFHNILQGVKQVEAEYFLWLEDDWELTALPQPEQVRPLFVSNQRLAQVRWPKYSYLLVEDKRLGRVADNVWIQGEFFSFNPHYARTAYVREALTDVLAGHAAGQNVEVACARALRMRGYVFGVWEPRFAAAIHTDQPGRDPAVHYRSHEVPELSPPGSNAGDAVNDPVETPSSEVRSRWISRWVEKNRASEFIGKPVFAIFAVLLSVLMIPFSLQARSFIRTVWWYWLPVVNSPMYLGATRYDAAPQPQRD